MVYACMQVSVAGTNALRPCLFRCVYASFCSLSVDCHADLHIWYVFLLLCLSVCFFIAVVAWITMNKTTYQCVILFIYHLSGSGVLHLNIRLASNSNVFFLFSPSFCAMFIETFMISQKKTTTPWNTMAKNCNHLRFYRLALQMRIICKPAFYVCVCAHTKQREGEKCRNYNCCSWNNIQGEKERKKNMKCKR